MSRLEIAELADQRRVVRVRGERVAIDVLRFLVPSATMRDQAVQPLRFRMRRGKHERAGQRALGAVVVEPIDQPRGLGEHRGRARREALQARR